MTFFGMALLTAIGTAFLAVFAVVTAWYARKAFREQSREVAAIEQQVKDEQELTRQQAKLLEVQTGQLELQRQQLEEQRAISTLQAEDLRESIRERERLRRAAERGQADEISFWMTVTPFPDSLEEGYDFAVDPGVPVHMAVVSNESRRPIKNVECRIGDASDTDLFPETHSHLAVIVGRLAAPDASGREDPRPVHPVPRSRVLQIRPGKKYGFVFEINSHRALALEHVAASFTDDAGLRWQIDRNQHLERLPDSE